MANSFDDLSADAKNYVAKLSDASSNELYQTMLNAQGDKLAAA